MIQMWHDQEIWNGWFWSMHHFVGIGVIQQEGRIFIHQRSYAQTLLENFGLNGCKPVPTPLATTDKLWRDDGSEAPNEEHYRKIVGNLLYLTTTRPSSLQVYTRIMHSPSTKHSGTARKVLRHIHDNWHGIKYKKGDYALLVGFCDNDWSGDESDMKFTSRYAFTLWSWAFSWAFVKQQNVALTTIEVEYTSASETTPHYLAQVCAVRFWRRTDWAYNLDVWQNICNCYVKESSVPSKI